MGKHRNDITLALLLTAIAISGGLIFWFSDKIKSNTSPLPSFASGTTSKISETETREEILAPNGKMTLILNTVKKDGTTTQTFFTKTEKDEEPTQIYSGDGSVSIPYNTFSPNNKYLFLKENLDSPKYVVLRTDGENIKEEEKSVEITALFQEKYPESKITDITGWGGNGLIVVNAQNPDEESESSYWFDLSDFGFIRLSTTFN